MTETITERILEATTPLWVSEERTLLPGDKFSIDYDHRGPDNLTARWVLVQVNAPALTPAGYKIP